MDINQSKGFEIYAYVSDGLTLQVGKKNANQDDYDYTHLSNPSGKGNWQKIYHEIYTDWGGLYYEGKIQFIAKKGGNQLYERSLRVNAITGNIDEDDRQNLLTSPITGSDYCLSFGLYDADGNEDVANKHRLFISLTRNQNDWQSRLFQEFKEKKPYETLLLKHLFIPGCHDSGMFLDLPVETSNLSNTQSISIRRQLDLGSRHLDFRPGVIDIDAFDRVMRKAQVTIGEGANLASLITCLIPPLGLLTLGAGIFALCKAEQLKDAVDSINSGEPNEPRHIHALVPGCTFKSMLEDVFAFLKDNKNEIVILEIGSNGIIDSSIGNLLIGDSSKYKSLMEYILSEKPVSVASKDSLQRIINEKTNKYDHDILCGDHTDLENSVEYLIQQKKRLIILDRVNNSDVTYVDGYSSRNTSLKPANLTANIEEWINTKPKTTSSIDEWEKAAFYYIPLQLTANGTEEGIKRGLKGTNIFTSPLKATKPIADMETYSYLANNNLNYHGNDKLFIAGNDFYDNGLSDTAMKVNRMKLGLVERKTPKYERNYLEAGDVLYAGELIYSTNKSLSLVFQKDGNLVMYHYGDKALWSAGCQGKGGHYLAMQSDGNLVVYKENGDAVWALGNLSYSRVSGAKFYIQNDANLVMYSGDNSKWASGQKLETA